MPKVSRRVENGRLVYYDKKPDPDFWDAHWAARINTTKYGPSLDGHLGVYEKPFRRYLPKDGKILEAGCGLARNVIALRANGFDCEGVDFGERTVRALQKKFPDLPVRVDDVTNLQVPDGFFSGYVSLGVVEHDSAGPEQFFKEAWRVLRRGGVAYISVPYANLIRRAKMKMGQYNEEPKEDQQFYQFAFTADEFTSLLTDSGFDVIATHGYGSYKGISDELSLFHWIDKIPKVSGAYRIFTRRMPYCDRVFGHMLGFVCLKR